MNLAAIERRLQPRIEQPCLPGLEPQPLAMPAPLEVLFSRPAHFACPAHHDHPEPGCGNCAASAQLNAAMGYDL